LLIALIRNPVRPRISDETFEEAAALLKRGMSDNPGVDWLAGLKEGRQEIEANNCAALLYSPQFQHHVALSLGIEDADGNHDEEADEEKDSEGVSMVSKSEPKRRRKRMRREGKVEERRAGRRRRRKGRKRKRTRNRRRKRSAARLPSSIPTDGMTSIETDWSSFERELGRDSARPFSHP